jgi:hypothetical protein
MYQQPTAPQSIGGVLDSGFRLYRESFSKVVWIAVVASLAAAPMNLVGPYVLANKPSANTIAAIVVGVLVLALVVAALNNALMARVNSIASASPSPLGEVLKVGVSRLPATIVCGIIMGVFAVLLLIPGGILMASIAPSIGAGASTANPGALLAALVLLLVPVSVVAIWFVFAPSAIIVERFGPLRSLGYSLAIVRGRWWRTAVLLTLLGILLIAIYFLLGLVAAVFAIASGSLLANGQLPWAFNLLVGPLVSAFAVPLVYSLMLSIYYDLKVRHEGGDLAARIAATA